MPINRRQFLTRSTAGAGVLFAHAYSNASAEDSPMARRVLGKTGEQVSLLCLGGSHIGEKTLTDEQAVSMMHYAIDMGVNFFDNAHAYHGGRSEVVMGTALKNGYRDKVFLMSKSNGRTAADVTEQLETSLRRLAVGHIDLFQVHEVVHPDHPAQVYDNGVLDVLVKAREEGKIRYIGVTGHSYPQFLNEMIDRGFPWDTIQMPLNVYDAHFRSFELNTLPKALENNMGVIAMKTMGGTPGSIPRGKQATPGECLRYAMTLPVSTVCSGMNTREVLEKNIQTALHFKPLDDGEREALLHRTRELALEGAGEPYKTLWHRDIIRMMEGDVG